VWPGTVVEDSNLTVQISALRRVVLIASAPIPYYQMLRIRELVAEVKFLTWTEDNLLRQVVYEGLREDKPAREVRREVPHAKP
jgi:ATP-dependent DNA ligase